MSDLSGGVIGPDERFPLSQTAMLGVQHLIAIFAATVLTPILIGFDPNVAVLMSSVGTLIFFLNTVGRVPRFSIPIFFGAQAVLLIAPVAILGG